MTFNRDKKADLHATNQLILKNIKPVSTGQSWLGHVKECCIIDYELLTGATDEELSQRSGRAPSGVDAHIYHLKAVHGLCLSKVNGVNKFEYYHTKLNRALFTADLEKLINEDIEIVKKHALVQLEDKNGLLKWYSIGMDARILNGAEIVTLTENKPFASILLNKKIGDYVDFGDGFKIISIKKYLSE